MPSWKIVSCPEWKRQFAKLLSWVVIRNIELYLTRWAVFHFASGITGCLGGRFFGLCLEGLTLSNRAGEGCRCLFSICAPSCLLPVPIDTPAPHPRPSPWQHPGTMSWFLLGNSNTSIQYPVGGTNFYFSGLKAFLLGLWIKLRQDFLLWLRVKTRLVSMRMRVRSLALLSGLRIRCCHELWHRSHTQLGSHNAVAVVKADSWYSRSTPSLGTSICHRWDPKKEKKKLLRQISIRKASNLLNFCVTWEPS